jgi:hypothetical protein
LFKRDAIHRRGCAPSHLPPPPRRFPTRLSRNDLRCGSLWSAAGEDVTDAIRKEFQNA